MKGVGLEIGLIEINQEEETCMFAQIERKTSILRLTLQSTHSSLSNLQQGSKKRRTKWPNCQNKESADGRSREAGRSLMKRD